MTAVSDSFGGTLAAWTAVNGSFSIVSGKMRGTTVANSPASYNRHDTSTGSIDCFCQAVISSTQTASFSNTGVACRMRSGANTSYQVTGRHAADTLMCWRIVAGSETQQTWQDGSQTLSVAWGSGDTLREEVVGSLIRAKVNGALVGLCVDTNITDGQLVGVNTYNDQAGDFGEYDDFAGGALAADGGLVAPYIAGVSAQVTGTGTTLTPTLPSNIATGDLVVVQCTSRDAAQTMTAPGSEGWSAGPSPSQTGLEDAVFYKVWGLGGQTDDSTPTFSIGSGTAGWGATAVIIRNPSHATAPWTSTSAAVVASGSGTNAASATVTAPSVNHDGSNRTIVRLYSSADDNALNAPSLGAMAYGGANYDSTTGNDFSQAMSLRENITVTTNTSTATVTQSVNGNDVSNGITLVLAIPSGTTVNATLTADLGGSASATATPDHPATLAASLGGSATATATPDHPATLAAALGGTASATATRQTFATASTDGGGTATATATPDHPAIAAADLGGLVAAATATPDHPAVLTADLGGAATATAVVAVPATASADLGFTGAATATRETAAVASADLGGAGAAVATPDHPAALGALLGGTGDATATVTHPVVAAAALGFSASAEATIPGGPIDAILNAALGGNAAATAGVDHAATAAASLGGAASAAAAPDHPAVLTADLGGTSAATAQASHPALLEALLTGVAQATATVTHGALAEAPLGFAAAATAAIPPTADPNPTVIRLSDTRSPVLADAGVPHLREPR
jgi:hypothetical protein